MRPDLLKLRCAVDDLYRQRKPVDFIIDRQFHRRVDGTAAARVQQVPSDVVEPDALAQIMEYPGPFHVADVSSCCLAGNF